MKKIFSICLIVLLNAIFYSNISFASNKPFIRSTFNANDEGWTAEQGEGEMTYHKKGGNRGGYLSFKDIGGRSYVAFPPPKFKGNLSRFDGGLLSYDILAIYPPVQHDSVGGGFGRINLRRGSLNATFDYAPYPPVPSYQHWTTYYVPMTASAWGVSQIHWESLLSNVTTMDILLDLVPGDDTIGLDNFMITAASKVTTTPEPVSTALFAMGGILFAVLKRKKLIKS